MASISKCMQDEDNGEWRQRGRVTRRKEEEENGLRKERGRKKKGHLRLRNDKRERGRQTKREI